MVSFKSCQKNNAIFPKPKKLKSSSMLYLHTAVRGTFYYFFNHFYFPSEVVLYGVPGRWFYPQRSSGQAVVTGVVLSPLRLKIRNQRPFSRIFHIFIFPLLHQKYPGSRAAPSSCDISLHFASMTGCATLLTSIYQVQVSNPRTTFKFDVSRQPGVQKRHESKSSMNV